MGHALKECICYSLVSKGFSKFYLESITNTLIGLLLPFSPFSE